MTSAGDFPKIEGDILYSQDVNKSYYAPNYIPFAWDTTAIENSAMNSILPHSSTVWSATNGGSQRVTADAGVTWAAATSVVANATASVVCEADKTKAIAFRPVTSNVVAFTADSGTNWSAAAVKPAGVTLIYCASFPTAAVAVCGTDDAAAFSVFRSTDGGNNWAICTSGPTAAVPIICMFSDTVGYAVDTSKNIWKTTDGGVNWSDTGDNTGITPNVAVNSVGIALSATICLFARAQNGTSSWVDHYDNSTGTVTKKFLLFSTTGTADSYLTNFLKTTNGNVYIVMGQGVTSGATYVMTNWILKSTDSGSTWSMAALPSSLITNFAGHSCQTFLSEYDTDKLLISLRNGTYLLLNESYD